ncbi:MAG: serine/threonine-protein kinase, partial [Myxococcota bacterium]
MSTNAATSKCPACSTPFEVGTNFCGVCGAALSHIGPSGDPYIGANIGGRYTVKQLIGRGGMGDVYLAIHEKLGQKVAIKFLPDRLSGQPAIVQRFFNEARSTCRVSHPNAVSLHDFGQSATGALYIIMEYIDGEPLSTVVRRDGRLPLPTILDITIQLCDALYAAHEQQVIHRDLKPDNIMLTRGRGGRYRVKVLDFGIAKLLDDGESSLTQTGTVFGTPEFMSPEQASGAPVDGRSDLYGVAMILYYLVCGGRLPFEGKDRIAILGRQVDEYPTPPSKRTPAFDIPPEVEAIIMRGLEKAAGKRYPSMAALAEALERIQAGPTQTEPIHTP